MTTLDKANGGIEIGVDTGGTFTDLVSVSATGERHIVKVPSTPHDPSEAILTGIAAVLRLSGHDAVEVQRLVHGTTVATNAVLERKGAKTGIIATEGFSDVLEIGRQMRSAVYDLELTPQTPVFLAPGARRTEVQERISASGEVLQALDEPSVLNALQQLVDQGVESVAVALLFAFLDARHEQRIAALAQQHFAHLSVSLSSEVDPAFREYERTVATAFDAYTKPILTRYLSRMAQALSERGVQAPFQVMHSRGGITSAASAAERPVRLFLSGPAAGVIGGGQTGLECDITNLMSVDIGGTSCDIALIADGKPLVRSEGQIDGYPVRVPMVDVNAIGAGGGSIAWLDGAGGLRVGPQSAGADPGPAAYAKGATQATVTDASLVLGLLNANNFAGGTMALDANKARAAIHETIAQPLGMTVEAAAQGIRQVINAQMAEGMRMVSIRQGYDPRDFALVALGGAGPVHALALAEELSISTVIVPRHPGVLSAEGLLMAPLEHSVAAGFPRKLSETCATEVRERLAQLDERAAALMVAEGLVDGAPDIQHFADVCYVGQSHYLEVALEPDSAEPLNAVYQAFIATHERVFGYATASPAQLVNLRSVHRSPVQKREDATPVAIRSAQTPEIRAVALDAAGHFQDVPIYQRDTLTPGQVFEGPAIIEQPDTTTVVHTGWQVTVLANGHLKLEQHKTL